MQDDEATADELKLFELEMRLLLDAIYLKYHFDFRNYALGSLRRRLLDATIRAGVTTLSQLQDRILRDPQAFSRLLDSLTVQVSEMFRDPSYFLAVRKQVAPLLRTYPSLKLWVAGCSSGEEAYSLAIVLAEEGLLEKALIYATDINPGALERAEAGIYSVDRLPTFSENYRMSGGLSSLSDYYTAAYGRAVFDKSLKEHIVFSDHSLATDSAFAEVEFVSCRNVLIYFDRALQDRALGLFHESLCRRGFLGIGSKESVAFSAYADGFEEFVRADRIFRKLGRGR